MYVEMKTAMAGPQTSYHYGQKVELPDAEANRMISKGLAVIALTPVGIALQTLKAYDIGVVYPVAGGDDVKNVVAMAEAMGMDAVPSEKPKAKTKAKAKAKDE